jgi:hypothetical protein
VGVGAKCHLFEAVDEIFSGDDVVGPLRVLRVADVVDGFEDDDVANSGLRDDVAVEASEGARAGSVMEDAVAADAFVEDTDVRGLLVAG